MNNKAFTLVELIVVITIIAILGTISFVSFQNYASTARDAKVISDLNNANKKLALFKIESGFVPKPDNAVEVIAGAWNIITFQWEFWENVKRILDYWEDIANSNGINYQYATNKTSTEYNIIGFLESPIANIITWVTFADNKGKYLIAKWNDILTLFDEENKFVSWDIQNLKTWEKTYLWKKELISESSKVVLETCQQILDLWVDSTDGIYKLNLSWWIRETYCDFDENWEAWALLLTADKNSTAFGNNDKEINQWHKKDLLWTIPQNSAEIYQDIDYKSSAYSELPTSKIKLCMIDSTKCYTFYHQQDISLFDFYDQNITFKEAGYNTYNVEPYEYKKEKIEKYEQSFWDYKVYEYKCAWLWINKMTKWDHISSGMWLLMDNDGWCAHDMAANDGHYDNWAFWIGLNSCSDGSTKTPKEERESFCWTWGSTSKSGIQRNINNVGGSSTIVWPWVVWGK